MRYDRATYVVRCSYVLIKTTRPRRARLPEDIPASSKLKFQSTRPRRARLTLRYQFSIPSCFNPRAHEGRDRQDSVAISVNTVSTHAPTKGATQEIIDCIEPTVVSTHAPTKGATTVNVNTGSGKIVSTHAPTKGATFATRSSTWRMLFQPTRPRRARHPNRVVCNK